jgi:hypothetical protein
MDITQIIGLASALISIPAGLITIKAWLDSRPRTQVARAGNAGKPNAAPEHSGMLVGISSGVIAGIVYVAIAAIYGFPIGSTIGGSRAVPLGVLLFGAPLVAGFVACRRSRNLREALWAGTISCSITTAADGISSLVSQHPALDTVGSALLAALFGAGIGWVLGLVGALLSLIGWNPNRDNSPG